MKFKAFGQHTQASSSVQPGASRYFTVALLAFLASFLLLPSSKAVNNLYYVSLALPALLLIVLGKVPRPHAIAAIQLWAVFFGWLFVCGIGEESQFFRHLLYTVLFCLIIFWWVDWRYLEKPLLLQTLFWGLIFYVTASALFFWYTNQLGVGVRVLALPARLDGPILTSMLIVSCFALVLPNWLRRGCWLNVIVACVTILFCVGFVLQSRTGLVGLALLLVFMCGTLLWRGRWLLRSAVVFATALGVGVAVWLLQSSEIAVSLLERADAGRFELWQSFWEEWRRCGFLLGCGPKFLPEIYITGGLRIEHPHNIFLAMGFRYGVPGLLLFIAVMVVTLRWAWQQKNPWGGYLLVALFMLNFDGLELISSPREVWLLILLPAFLIAAQQRWQSGHTASWLPFWPKRYISESR